MAKRVENMHRRTKVTLFNFPILVCLVAAHFTKTLKKRMGVSIRYRMCKAGLIASCDV